MRSSGLRPGCSAILNKCWSSDPCQRSQFDNRIRSVRPTDPDHAIPIGSQQFSVMLHFVSNEITALLQVIMIDLVLAGDNAIVIGLAAAGLPLQQRTKAVLVGIIAATVLRITFAAATTQLLQVVGLVLAGGILLLWVSWKMFRELRALRRGEGRRNRSNEQYGYQC